MINPGPRFPPQFDKIFPGFLPDKMKNSWKFILYTSIFIFDAEQVYLYKSPISRIRKLQHTTNPKPLKNCSIKISKTFTLNTNFTLNLQLDPKPLTLAKGYSIVDWRFIDLMNLQCESLIHPANHNMI